MMTHIRNLKAAITEMIGQWAPAAGEATTYFRPMPWEVDRAGNIKAGVAVEMARLAGRSWQGGAGLGRSGPDAGADTIVGDIATNGRFIAFEPLSISTRLVGQTDGYWTLEHRIESDDKCAKAVFITRRAMSQEGRWSLFSPKPPAARSDVPEKVETPVRKAA
jgi:hypothetical protein